MEVGIHWHGRRTDADGSLPPDIFVLDDHSLLGNGSILPHANLRDGESMETAIPGNSPR